MKISNSVLSKCKQSLTNFYNFRNYKWAHMMTGGGRGQNAGREDHHHHHQLHPRPPHLGLEQGQDHPCAAMTLTTSQTLMVVLRAYQISQNPGKNTSVKRQATTNLFVMFLLPSFSCQIVRLPKMFLDNKVGYFYLAQWIQ